MMKQNKSNVITVRMDDELLEALKANAKQERRPLAMQIRKILIDYIGIKNGKQKDQCT
jgi:hypothetical protein